MHHLKGRPVNMRVARILFASIAILGLFALAGAPATATSPVEGLHVQGNRILNNAGQPIQLRGVNKAGTEYMCLGGSAVFDGPSDQASIDAMRAWAINAVRLPINESCWLGINGAPGGTLTAPAYRSAIVAYVDRLTASGIASIVDLQWAAPGATKATTLTPMPDRDHAPAFWQSAAETFKANQSVIFDLFNEPFPDNNSNSTAAWTCLRDGGTCPGVPYQAAGMQELLNTVRATGAQNVVMVPGVQFTNVLDQWLTYRPSDDLGNVAAAWHSYDGQSCSGQSCWDSQIAPVADQVPVIVGEIGENDCQHQYIDPLMAWLDQHGVHYLGWAWNTYDCGGFPGLISSYDGTPTNFGVGLRNHLLEQAGISTPTPRAIPYLSQTYPFGINVGSTSAYTASDGTVYLADAPTAGLASDLRFFPAYASSEPISGTTDPALFQKGRSGAFGNWTINVPNGTYEVTLGAAPTQQNGTGEYGQDQSVMGQKVGTCVWSNTPNFCPHQGVPPVLDQALTVTYTANVFDQQLTIQSAASFGDNRKTILSMIRVARTGQPPATPAPTSTSTPAPTATPTPEPAATAAPTATAVVSCELLVRLNGSLKFIHKDDPSLCRD